MSNSNSPHTCQIAIIGAGFGGLATAIRLQKEGYNSFLIFEQAAAVGGTWRDNVYPGCACDVPSHLYSFSFEQNPEWSQHYSKQPEIFNYLKNCVDKYKLTDKIKFQTTISALTFVEQGSFWKIQTTKGETFTAQIVVSATGPLNRPNIPKIDGLSTFQGKQFHTFHWDNDYDLTNKKVAVIGTGASAIQFVPEIAPKVKTLHLFQRTPPWVLPKPNRKITKFEHWLFKKFPIFQRLQRRFIYWAQEFTAIGFLGNFVFLRFFEKLAKRYLKAKIKDAELRQKLSPDYRIGCKRILLSSNYYPALTRKNVHVQTDGIAKITANSIIDKKGKEHLIDALILSTGFQATEPITMTIKGKNNRELLKEWKKNGTKAYYGISVSGYPNLFFLLGPNTGLGHNSVIYMIESQVNYLVDYLKNLAQKKVAYFDVKSSTQTTFNQEIQEKIKPTVWQSGGCRSWYQTDAGENTTLWPGFTTTYRKLTRKVNLEDFD